MALTEAATGALPCQKLSGGEGSPEEELKGESLAELAIPSAPGDANGRKGC